ncbi:MAG TPA: fumarylacetoacetate hydrolase, partial [Rhodoferax sp.]
MFDRLSTSICLPVDAATATLVGRVWLNDVGPVLVCIKPDGVYDLSSAAVTMSELLELDDPVSAVRQHGLTRIGDTQAVLRNSSQDERNTALPWFLAPCDLQAIKASGVTFISSMLERVIEEQARGDASRADSVRQAVVAVIGDN